MNKIIIILLMIPIVVSCQNTKLKKAGIDETEYVPTGINKEAIAPLINTFSIRNKAINSAKILEEKQLVVIFYRGKWCPVCNKYLNNLADSLQYITNKNALVLIVGPESIENAEKTENKTSSDFILIADKNAKIQKYFDVLFTVNKSYQNKIKIFLATDIAKNNEQEKAQLPVPATFIINKKGVISFKHFDYDYNNRASVKAIVDAL